MGLAGFCGFGAKTFMSLFENGLVGLKSRHKGLVYSEVCLKVWPKGFELIRTV